MLFMISCRRASKLMSKKFDQPLNINQELRLRVHLMICKSCPRLHQQFEILHQAGQHFTQHPADPLNEPALTPAAKQRILQKLQDVQTATAKKNPD